MLCFQTSTSAALLYQIVTPMRTVRITRGPLAVPAKLVTGDGKTCTAGKGTVKLKLVGVVENYK